MTSHLVPSYEVLRLGLFHGAASRLFVVHRLLIEAFEASSSTVLGLGVVVQGALFRESPRLDGFVRHGGKEFGGPFRRGRVGPDPVRTVVIGGAVV